MGAWGYKFYENDDAADWLADFAEDPSWDVCEEALAFDDDYIEADPASIAIAAAEVIAAARGKAHPELDSNIAEWAKENAVGGQSLIDLAITALNSVSNESELKELWEEGDDAHEWHTTISELQSRLNS